MRIDCPSCAAAYQVPASILTRRRLMRCARCGAEFTPASPVEAGQAQDTHAQVGHAQVGQAQVGQAHVGQAHVGQAHVGQAHVGQAHVGQAQDAAPGAQAVPAPMVFAPPAAATRLDERMGLSVVPQQGAPAPNRAGILAAWILSLVLLGAGTWAVVTWRGAIVRAWPPSARLYAALGYAR